MLLTATLASGVFGAMISARVFKNIDKVKGFKAAMLLEALLLLGMYFIPGSNVMAIFAGAATQSDSALEMIRLLFTVCPAVLVALLVVIMRKYSLNDKTLMAMTDKDVTV